jgi:LmbE family N-acetylglucosaminyl deacetylase
MNYLIVAAHPDDEVLGAGATIHKLTADGNQVAVATMVSHAEARKDLSETLSEDHAEACGILGVTKLYGADFPNIRMNTVPHLELVQFVENCIDDFKAEAIITHHPSDTNNDHVMTSYAVQAATRLFQRREGVPLLQKLLYMEVLSSTEWSLDTSSSRFTPNYFVETGKEGIEIKLKALSAYKGVMRPYPHPRSREALEGLAAYRGAQAGCCYAEAFETALIINRKEK